MFLYSIVFGYPICSQSVSGRFTFGVTNDAGWANGAAAGDVRPSLAFFLTSSWLKLYSSLFRWIAHTSKRVYDIDFKILSLKRARVVRKFAIYPGQTLYPIVRLGRRNWFAYVRGGDFSIEDRACAARPSDCEDTGILIYIWLLPKWWKTMTG